MEWSDPLADYDDRRDRVLDRADGTCRVCGSTDGVGVRPERPLAAGGSLAVENLEAVCRDCHAEERPPGELVRDDLYRAIAASRRIRLDYRRPDGLATYDLDPYGVTDHDGGTYLVAFDHGRSDARAYRVGGVESVTLLGEAFDRPSDWRRRLRDREDGDVDPADGVDAAGDAVDRATTDVPASDGLTEDRRSRESGAASTSRTPESGGSTGDRSDDRAGDDAGGRRPGDGHSGSRDADDGGGDGGDGGWTDSSTGSTDGSSGGLLGGGGGGGGGGIDGDCFLATAAYGTPLAVEIDVLRDFRDDGLRRSTAGRLLVALYYALSPPVARWIARSERRRRLVRRAVVAPLVRLVGRWRARSRSER